MYFIRIISQIGKVHKYSLFNINIKDLILSSQMIIVKHLLLFLRFRAIFLPFQISFTHRNLLHERI